MNNFALPMIVTGRQTQHAANARVPLKMAIVRRFLASDSKRVASLAEPRTSPVKTPRQFKMTEWSVIINRDSRETGLVQYHKVRVWSCIAPSGAGQG